VTILSENGAPTPVAHTKLRPPVSRMGPADDVDAAATASPLFAKYGTRVDAQSARELLAAPWRSPPRPRRRRRDRRLPLLERRQAGPARGHQLRGVFGLLKKL
jgi:hypothetical protein